MKVAPKVRETEGGRKGGRKGGRQPRAPLRAKSHRFALLRALPVNRKRTRRGCAAGEAKEGREGEKEEGGEVGRGGGREGWREAGRQGGRQGWRKGGKEGGHPSPPLHSGGKCWIVVGSLLAM